MGSTEHLALLQYTGIPISLVILGLSFLVFAAWLVRRDRRLAHIPGPAWCRFTDVPRLRWAWSERIHETHIALHRRYGDLVRVGPHCVSIGTPRAIQAVYGTGANLPKGDFYKVLQPLAHGRVVQGLFNTQDEALHRALKRPIAGIYSMTNLVSFEPYVDTTIAALLRQLEARSAAGTGTGTVDLGAWLQFFAFDVMGEITFSRRFGFLDTGRDVDSMIRDIYRFFAYGSAVGQMPLLDRLWAKNRLVNWLLPAKNSSVVAFAQARAQEREAVVEKDEGDSYNSRDFMSRFLETRRKDPSIPPHFLTAWTTSNVQAGSDTTAILLRAIVHFLLTSPASLQKLRAELDSARQAGHLGAASTNGIVSWKESRDLPYLDACIKEAGRLHSPVGLAMERVVSSAKGIEVCGAHLPKGTVVGLNPWVVHRDPRIFGDDADAWNPDRWMRPKDETRAAMERSLLTFGAGHRTCLGKNISYLEIYKLIPTLFAKYDITFATPDEWKLVNHWLVFQQGLNVRIRVRDDKQIGDEKMLA
ncbi:Cytochrome P450 family protein [Sporothrix brasiliensis 5110]|uniref:Cytochrome P450 family protein n=1 Tax=Sporothrix brasiliensis 5110 TaxID=1398154 RepID=A0A0C2IUR4_9PEZI|nr:Cytochrome P450 family protein [Sporothrix brasiliensis 5110]KIH90520.1 Cytochrome P450 family protein [Sporothrix brasiliensis 5110]